MKKMVHKGLLYVASVALSLIGLVGFPLTASAQVLRVLGTNIPNPTSTDMNKTGNQSTDHWTGSWSWDASSKTRTLKNLKSTSSAPGIYVKDISIITVNVEGQCEFDQTEAPSEVVDTIIMTKASGLYIKGVGSGASLKVYNEVTRSGIGILIANNKGLIVENCLLDVLSVASCGIKGYGDGHGVGIRLKTGARLEAKGNKGAIADVQDYIKVTDDGTEVLLNNSKTYARTDQFDKEVEFKNGYIVYKGTKTIVGSQWISIDPY